MGPCLSIPDDAARRNAISKKLDVTSEITHELGRMNSAITKETRLLTECRNTAATLFLSICDRANPPSDAVNLARVTEKLDQMIGHMGPIKSALMNNIKALNNESNKLYQSANNARLAEPSMGEVIMLHTAATLLSPNLNDAVRTGQQLRHGADAIFNLLSSKYSVH